MDAIDTVAGQLSRPHVAWTPGTHPLWQRFGASLARWIAHWLDLERKVPYY